MGTSEYLFSALSTSTSVALLRATFWVMRMKKDKISNHYGKNNHN